MSEVIPIVGLDPSLRNWGIAQGYINALGEVTITNLDVVKPVLSKSKQVRQNSLDLESARQLCTGVLQAVQGAKAVFVEVPIGSQSARSMASYGICVGILGALRASGIPFFEVTPTEVKLAGPGNKTATKKDMIQWASKQHPEVQWPVHTRKSKTLITEDTAEHMADAVAAIYAGIRSNPFQQILPFLK